MSAKVIHDDLNAGGGSEYLAISTIIMLHEIGFEVDLASFRQPNFKEIEKNFGTTNLTIRKVKTLDLFSLLQIKEHSERNLKSLTYDDDDRYDLVINTHGDLLPYYNENSNKNHIENIITYCHYPLVPLQIQDGSYIQFINKWTTIDMGLNKVLQRKVLTNAMSIYDSMMQHGTILTNSFFSKDAIVNSYKQVKPIVVYPPVNVEKFYQCAFNPKKTEDTVLVLSRFSPDKQIENAIKIALVMRAKGFNFKMTLAGNISDDNLQYLKSLECMIKDNNLSGHVTIEADVSFSRLLELMKESKVLLHPLSGEPFGIAIVEAMSAGLIPVVPNVGGNMEFVPPKYHYGTFEEAANIISKFGFASTVSEMSTMSEIASRFSVKNYKNNFKKVIDSILARTQDRAS
jgi:alpha-1,2-mannosyltransferase